MTDKLYFLREGSSGPIKIGYTHKDPRYRLVDMQRGNPRLLHLIAIVLGGRDSELAWHKRHSEARLTGEWFNATPALLSEIASKCLTGEALEAYLYDLAHRAPKLQRLYAWMRKTGRDEAWIAKATGLDFEYVRRGLHGQWHGGLSLRLANAVSRVSDGAFSFHDLYFDVTGRREHAA